MNAFIALTLNGFREARRNRVTVVAGAFALLSLFFAALLTNLSISTFDRVLTDVGIGVMSIMLILLAVFLSSGMLSREIERRTLFLVVSKPISRSLFLLGRFAGNMLTLLVLLAGMAAVFFIEVALYGTHITQAQIVAVGMIWFELLVLSSIGFAVSSFSSQMVSGTVTIGAYFAGHLAGDIYDLAQRTEEAGLRFLLEAAYYVLPHLERVNFRTHATYEQPVPAGELLSGAGYATAYAVVMLSLAVLLFRRRDFK